MANNLTNYAEDELLDHVLGTAAFTSPAQVFVALYTAVASQEVPTVTEVAGGSYARQPVDFAVASGGATSQPLEVLFPTATADWGTITHVGLVDAVSGGNALLVGSLDAPKAISTGDAFRFAPGDLEVSLD